MSTATLSQRRWRTYRHDRAHDPGVPAMTSVLDVGRAAPAAARAAGAGGQRRLELAVDGAVSRTMQLRLESARGTSGWFPWAELSPVDAAATPDASGLRLADLWTGGGRCFAELVS